MFLVMEVVATFHHEYVVVFLYGCGKLASALEYCNLSGWLHLFCKCWHCVGEQEEAPLSIILLSLGYIVGPLKFLSYKVA
jgi:hypothetical protein